MKDFLETLGFVIGAYILVIVLAIATGWIYYLCSVGTYNYIDMEGNAGVAKICMVDEGHLVCQDKDGLTFQVKQYDRQ